MPRDLYRYVIDDEICIRDAEKALRLARLVAEILHGEVSVSVDAYSDFDPLWRVCVIDAGTPVGRDLNRLFAGFLLKGLGQHSLNVCRIPESEFQPTEFVL